MASEAALGASSMEEQVTRAELEPTSRVAGGGAALGLPGCAAQPIDGESASSASAPKEERGEAGAAEANPAAAGDDGEDDGDDDDDNDDDDDTSSSSSDDTSESESEREGEGEAADVGVNDKVRASTPFAISFSVGLQHNPPLVCSHTHVYARAHVHARARTNTPVLVAPHAPSHGNDRTIGCSRAMHAADCAFTQLTVMCATLTLQTCALLCPRALSRCFGLNPLACAETALLRVQG